MHAYARTMLPTLLPALSVGCPCLTWAGFYTNQDKVPLPTVLYLVTVSTWGSTKVLVEMAPLSFSFVTFSAESPN